AFAQKDCEGLADAAHPLASSSGALGFIGLASLARTIERTISSQHECTTENKAFLEQSLKLLRESLMRVEAYIEGFSQRGIKGKKKFSSNKKKIRVMHIDDDPVICRITKVYLDNSGYFETKSFSNIKDSLIAASFCPDIILVDFIMPDTEGDISLLSLKADPRLSDVPVIFITGLEKEFVQDKLDGAISGYMKKPYMPEELVAYILKVYNREIISHS
ncbi:MAG: response regulator, partial [Alphaproteobacteria bacterium]|nr:response regulator [Alphaproteobacteria bacterium]